MPEPKIEYININYAIYKNNTKTIIMKLYINYLQLKLFQNNNRAKNKFEILLLKAR